MIYEQSGSVNSLAAIHGNNKAGVKLGRVKCTANDSCIIWVRTHVAGGELVTDGISL